MNKILVNTNETSTKINSLLDSAVTTLETIEGNVTSSTNSLEKIKEKEEEIEKKKLQINSFHENIEEYKDSINNLERKAKEIIAKETEINNLISQAEKALDLKSTEGISAAFAARYIIASDKKMLKAWIGGAISLIIVAIVLTIWIIGGWFIKDPQAIGSIVGRIVAVGIAVAGATFCSKQYIKQKNIAEDYAYKATLSKSIIAFTQEIKKRDDKQVATYLNKVLEEIHKDPLRKRGDEDESSINANNIGIVEKLINSIKANSTNLHV